MSDLKTRAEDAIATVTEAAETALETLRDVATSALLQSVT